MPDLAWAWFAAVVVCIVCSAVSWAIRQRRKCFKDFEGTRIPTVPLRSLINGNADEYWKPTTIESIGRWLKEYGDVFGFYLGDAPIVVVKDLDMIDKMFVKDLKNFTARGHTMHVHELQPAFVRNILFTKGNVWKDMRNTMAQFFTQSKLKTVMPSLMDAQNRFIEILDECADQGKEVDINTLCERLTFDVVSKTAFGIDTNVQRNPQYPLFQIALVTVPSFMAGFFYRLAQNLFHWPWLFKAFSQVIDVFYVNPMVAMTKKAVDVIEFRRQNPQLVLPDMAQILLDDALERKTEELKKKNEPIKTPISLPMETMTDIATNCMNIFLGGYDPTRLALTYWFYVMGRYPDIQEKMRTEVLDAFKKEGDELSMHTLLNLPYTNQVISETLRMYPPLVTLIARGSDEDFQCGKYLIKKGMSIMSPTYQLHYDPQYWTNPQKFDPESPNWSWIPTQFSQCPRKRYGWKYTS
ncbi:probable cytochrome P450 6a13 isoform X2 [Dermacentor andersoni]|uniref:probable cytochrome P450 6a13 isoform X2 n=1 Tax=Dermacentor andersoni TaxID=34620 RepID=UPI003B3B98BE